MASRRGSAARTVVRQHLRRHRVHTGLRLEQHEQDVGRRQHPRQFVIRLERDLFETRRRLGPEPIGADAFGRHDHPNIGIVREGLGESEQQFGAVLEAERAGIQQHDLMRLDAVALGPRVGSNTQRNLFERRPVLDDIDSIQWNAPVDQRVDEGLADDDNAALERAIHRSTRPITHARAVAAAPPRRRRCAAIASLYTSCIQKITGVRRSFIAAWKTSAASNGVFAEMTSCGDFLETVRVNRHPYSSSCTARRPAEYFAKGRRNSMPTL